MISSLQQNNSMRELCELMANIPKKKMIPSLGEIFKNLDYYLAVVCMLFVTIYCFINVACRFFIGKTSASLDELNIIVFVWFLYAAIAYCVRIDKHIRIEFLDIYLSDKYQSILKILADTIWIIFSAYLAYGGLQLIVFNTKYMAKTSMLQIPVFAIYSVIFISFAAMTVFLIRNIFTKIKNLRSIIHNNGSK